MTPLDWAAESWLSIAGALHVSVAVTVTVHVVLNHRDYRSAVGWVGLVWLSPVLGACVYAVLGINRIKRRASTIRAERGHVASAAAVAPCTAQDLAAVLGPVYGYLVSLSAVVERVGRRRLVPGNRIEPLVNGDAAYPSMLAAIESAQSSVSLGSYIFNNDSVGRRFAEALARAVARGVAVRILVDAVGARYSYPSILRVLWRAGVPASAFMPTHLPWRIAYMNLRNHRKLLIVDGHIGFTGGMNLQEAHILCARPRHPVQDVHFRIEGPVVAHLQEAFAEDWAFTTGEILAGPTWYPGNSAVGDSIARGIVAGPDEDFERLRWAILGALASARESICVVTPYFLPDSAVGTALCVAALSGLAVDLVLPEQNNRSLVKWACDATLREFLEHGCRVWKTPPPFDHTKLMVVDGIWVLLGSANWDARSLRLNFEFNVECYDRELASSVQSIIDLKLRGARRVTMQEIDHRNPVRQVRDGFARLLTPYL